jgi:hypothetical protein
MTKDFINAVHAQSILTMDRVCAWLGGRQVVSGAACIATIPTLRQMSNGIPVTLARPTDELRKYHHGLKVMSGGFTLSG